MNNKKITRILVLLTVGLFFLAVYSGYLLYTYSAPAKKSADAGRETEDLRQVEVKITEFNTDKPTYSSYEEIELKINLLAETEIKNAEIRVAGIQPHQIAYLKEEKIIDLPKGESTILIESQAPSCTSGCGGVYPGPYDITVELLVEDNLIDSRTTTIELVED